MNGQTLSLLFEDRAQQTENAIPNNGQKIKAIIRIM